jgi:hypothetical protein
MINVTPFFEQLAYLIEFFFQLSEKVKVSIF